jgi:hypothetical protein
MVALDLSPEMLLYGGAGVLLASLVLLVAGMWPRRRGEEPHCRKCDYNLTGLPSDRCPECGGTITAKSTVHGERRRRPGLMLVGVALLLAAPLPFYHAAKQVDWYPYYPASWVIRDLRTNNYTKAFKQLAWRIKTGRVSSVVRGLAKELDKNPYHRACYALLAMAGTPKAIAYFERTLQSPDVQARRAAVDGLAEGDRWAVQLLMSALDDSGLYRHPPPIDLPDVAQLSAPASNEFHPNEAPSPFEIQPSIGQMPWPEEHEAHQALFQSLYRFGLKGESLNLAGAGGRSFDVRQEIRELKEWWAKHGDDFMQGKTVPAPKITMVFLID